MIVSNLDKASRTAIDGNIANGSMSECLSVSGSPPSTYCMFTMNSTKSILDAFSPIIASLLGLSVVELKVKFPTR